MSTALISGTIVEGAAVTNGVNGRCKAYTDLMPAWNMVTALLGGTTAMRAKREEYLPKFPQEAPATYEIRLKASTLFPAFKRTVTTLAARPFSKPITTDKVAENLKPLLENIDRQGNNLDVFASETFKYLMAYGLIALITEHPIRPAEAKTIADDKALGMAPYLVRIYPEQFLGFILEVNGGAVRLTQFRYLETIEEKDGEYATKCVQQIRVLMPGKWEIHRANANGTWDKAQEGTNTLKEIPLVMLYGERTGYMTGKPVLLELAHLNIKHWQQQSDQDSLMHIARVPILTVRGVDDKFEFVFGANNGVNLKENPNAEMKFVEHTGAAIDSGKTQLDDLKEEMRQSGAELLVLAPGPTTATEIASDNAVGMCALQEMTASLEDGLNQSLLFMSQYLGGSDGGKVEVFKDFAAATLAEASMQIVVSMGTAGTLSKKTVINEGKRRGILSADVDPDTEASSVESEGPPVGKTDPLTGLPYTEPVPPGGPAKKPPPGAKA